ncbi:MAG TPA: ABC transporter ATP-binding protein [Candidatus Xenobia bacterium]|nr:ABC transporter ATP-binding protein [Candidatus Xenobia bacterium]
MSEANPSPPRWERLRPLFPYLRRYRGRIVLGLVCLLANNGIWMTFPVLLGQAIDALTAGATLRTLMLYGAALLGIAAGRGFFLYAMRLILINVSRDIEYDQRNDLFLHLEKQSPRFYSTWRIGDLMSRLTNDLAAVRMMVGPAVMYSANSLVAFPLAIGWMLYIDWKLTLLVLVPVPAVILAVKHFSHIIHVRFERIQAKMSDLTARVQESIAGVRLLRAFNQDRAQAAAFDALNRDYVETNRGLIRVQAGFFPALAALLTFAFLVVLWFGGRAVLAKQISVGSFVAFTQYMFLLAWPMIALGWVINLFERGTASLGRLDAILRAQPDIRDRAAPDAPDEIRGEIELRNLSFRYNGVPVLQGINLHIRAGSTTAIVGPTGSGKSTLVHLIGRLWDAPEGAVLVDGRPVTAHRLEALRRAIGYVPQETFLFTTTLRENIALGAPDAPEEKIRWAAEIAGLADDIAGFPKGYETLVGERGITLSGGQKQRAAIARAILRDPRILILDDALSSVDTVTEEKILRGLAGVMRQRTTILISHRVSTVRDADQIVVLREGRIVERGTHSELLARGGYYYDLYQKQLLEEELERE